MTQADPYFANDRREVLPLVPSGVQTLLDVGCGEGAFMRSLKMDRPTIEVCGIESNEAVAAKGRAAGSDILTGRYPEVVEDLSGQRFDCVAFNDVLEHLADPWAALHATHSILTEGGLVVASVPNVRHHSVVQEIVLDGDFRYRDAGVLDRTHLRFFTMTSAERMFAECGYQVRSIAGIVRRRPRHRDLPRLLPILAQSASLRKQMAYRQFVVVAERA